MVLLTYVRLGPSHGAAGAAGGAALLHPGWDATTGDQERRGAQSEGADGGEGQRHGDCRRDPIFHVLFYGHKERHGGAGSGVNNVITSGLAGGGGGGGVRR